jgi:hypothetical protein
VDGLRLVAAVQMIQGHTLDALLASSLRHGPWFRAWTFSRGLTSTAFLFTAGVSFALAHAAGAERGAPSAARSRRVKRALLLIAIGYLMRAPLGVFWGDALGPALRNALAVDVLQCIGVSLLLLEGLAAAVQNQRVRAGVAALFGTLCFVLAAPFDGLHGAGLLALTNYFSAADGSLFPLLPAAGYVFWGLAIADTTLLSRAAGVRGPALGLLAWGALALLAALMSFWFAPPVAARLSPAYAALKLGWVLVFAAFLAFLLAERQLPRALRELASETLFLYASHVLVLYAGHVGLAALLGRSQSLGLASLWTLGMLFFSGLGALGYGWVLRALRARLASGTPRPQSPLSLG